MFVLHHNEKPRRGTEQFDTAPERRLGVVSQCVGIQENNRLEFHTRVRLDVRPREKLEFFTDKLDAFSM
jgi:hypothetical protein